MVIYFLVAFSCGGLILLLRSKIVILVLRCAFVLNQLRITLYAFLHRGADDALYFNFDSIGIILATVLTILSVATFYHSSLYLKRHPTSEKNESIYYASLILLITAMTGAYFTNHMGVLWAWLEATTLSVSVLIYHDRTATSLEATWKYVFICSIGISIAFIGILFLSIVATKGGLTDLYLPGLMAAGVRAFVYRIQRQVGDIPAVYRMCGCPYGLASADQCVHFNFINECWVFRHLPNVFYHCSNGRPPMGQPYPYDQWSYFHWDFRHAIVTGKAF